MSLFGRVKHQGRELTSRALERHLRLGVTGLSGSGKTAFITSLVHQLTQGDDSGNLPFFDVVQQQRLVTTLRWVELGKDRSVPPEVHHRV